MKPAPKVHLRQVNGQRTPVCNTAGSAQPPLPFCLCYVSHVQVAHPWEPQFSSLSSRENDEKVTFSALPFLFSQACPAMSHGEGDGARTSAQSWEPGEGHPGQRPGGPGQPWLHLSSVRRPQSWRSRALSGPSLVGQPRPTHPSLSRIFKEWGHKEHPGSPWRSQEKCGA